MGHKLLFLPCALCALNFAFLLATLPKTSSLFQDFSLWPLVPSHLLDLMLGEELLSVINTEAVSFQFLSGF